jgi:transposase InsO family protein
VEWHFIRPGKPIENACIESFNARFRDECLNDNWFTKFKKRDAGICSKVASARNDNL